MHLTQIVGDKMQKLDLCEDCAKAKGVNDPASFAMADIMLGLGAAQELEQSVGGVEVKCPRCGFTQADFKKTGRLGCSECYVTFAEGLASLIKAMHKGTKHTGKVPARLFRDIVRSDRLNELKRSLEEAVSKEDYESAATIRDEIRQLELEEMK